MQMEDVRAIARTAAVWPGVAGSSRARPQTARSTRTTVQAGGSNTCDNGPNARTRGRWRSTSQLRRPSAANSSRTASHSNDAIVTETPIRIAVTDRAVSGSMGIGHRRQSADGMPSGAQHHSDRLDAVGSRRRQKRELPNASRRRHAGARDRVEKRQVWNAENDAPRIGSGLVREPRERLRKIHDDLAAPLVRVLYPCQAASRRHRIQLGPASRHAFTVQLAKDQMKIRAARAWRKESPDGNETRRVDPRDNGFSARELVADG